MSTKDDKPYKDVQSLVRGLRIVEALSELGWARIGPLSEAARIERSSAYRIVHTLEQLGYVTRRGEDGAVALTTRFAYLAEGLRDDDVVTQFAWPNLFELTKELLWPCDFASLEGGKVLIRLSTHKISPMSIHRAMVGKERLLTRSALGMAILSAMSVEALDASLDVVARLGGPNADDIHDRDAVHSIAQSVRQRGYASAAGLTESKISAIAVPVLAPDRTVAGAINVVFFRSVMTPEQAADRYLVKLRTCVSRIEDALVNWEERKRLAVD
ncbi:IclR family transcriptional regulator domain-containing protein [Sphingomonas sp.]|uniref:IclR family transcriptional regulator domain-containing protein n=1 Tax=Sphingomonas sp. TaxID=28214 RepID=UPI003AFFF4CA